MPRKAPEYRLVCVRTPMTPDEERKASAEAEQVLSELIELLAKVSAE